MRTMTFSWKSHCTVIVHIALEFVHIALETISKEQYFLVLICIVFNFRNNIEDFSEILKNTNIAIQYAKQIVQY